MFRSGNLNVSFLYLLEQVESSIGLDEVRLSTVSTAYKLYVRVIRAPSVIVLTHFVHAIGIESCPLNIRCAGTAPIKTYLLAMMANKQLALNADGRHTTCDPTC